jgi:ABC-2 type transport system ATP-binding protein
LLDFDQGAVTVAGYDLRHNARSIRALIGLVPQAIALQSSLTAAENVAYFASLYGLRGAVLKESVAEALAFVGLAEYAKRRAGKMSGGMQRRLNIACGLAHKPQLIVLDEPTVGVDAQSREHIMESIRTLRNRGATIIYTSHYMPEVQEMCDRIAIIDHGKLVAIGTEEELISIVVDVKAITIDSAPPLNLDRELLLAKLSTLPDVRRVALNDEATQLRIEVPLNFSNASVVLRMLMDLGLQIQSLTSDLPDLETTFLALTGRELRQG